MSEIDLHRSVAELLDWVILPPAMWTTFPAGWTKMRKGAAGRLRGCGLKAGMPDILVFYSGCALTIELKTEKGRLSKEQFETTAALGRAGIPVHVCRSVDDVHRALAYHQIPMRSFNLGYTQTKARRPPQPDASATTA
jgi:hypothetical protein